MLKHVHEPRELQQVQEFVENIVKMAMIMIYCL